MKDIDTEWNATHGQQETPQAFNLRYDRDQLTEAEKQATADCETSTAAFRTLYPMYVTLHEWRMQFVHGTQHPSGQAPVLSVGVSSEDESDE